MSGAEAMPTDVAKRSSNRELDALFDQAPVALVLFDRKLRAKRTNAAFRQMAGLADKAIIGRRPSEIDDGMDVALIERTLDEQVMKEGVPVADVFMSVETRTGSCEVPRNIPLRPLCPSAP